MIYDGCGQRNPFIWNQSLTKNLVLLKNDLRHLPIVSTVAGALGIGLGASTAPSSIAVPDACFAANNPGVLSTGTTMLLSAGSQLLRLPP